MNGRDVVERVSPVGRRRRRHIESRCCASAARDFWRDGRASKQKGGKVGSKAGLLRQPRLCRAEALEGKSWQQGRPMTAAAQSRRQFAQVQSVRLGWEREKSLNGVGKVGSKAGLLRQPRRAEGSAAGSDGAQSPQTVCGVYLSWVSLSQSTHLPRRGVTTYNVRLNSHTRVPAEVLRRPLPEPAAQGSGDKPAFALRFSLARYFN